MADLTSVKIFTEYLGDWDNLLKAYTLTIVVGIIADAIISIVNHKNLSQLTLTLFAQKIVEYIIIGIGNIMDISLVMEDISYRKLTIMFYITYETLRIIDNAIEIGLPVPSKIKKLLECVFNKEYDKDMNFRK